MIALYALCASFLVAVVLATWLHATRRTGGDQ